MYILPYMPYEKPLESPISTHIYIYSEYQNIFQKCDGQIHYDMELINNIIRYSLIHFKYIYIYIYSFYFDFEFNCLSLMYNKYIKKICDIENWHLFPKL